MNKQIRRILKDIFSEDVISKTLPGDDELYAYVEAKIRGEAVATSFPDIDRYLQSVNMKDEHYQALVHLLTLEQSGKLEKPPIAPQFDFSYLTQPTPSKPFWIFALGQILINFTQERLDSLVASYNPTLAFKKSSSSPLLFETTVGDEQSGVKAKIQARHEKNQAIPTVGLMVKVEIPAQKLLNMPPIPVEVAVAERNVKQITDKLGSVLFSHLPLADLPSLSIAIGPVPTIEKAAE